MRELTTRESQRLLLIGVRDYVRELRETGEYSSAEILDRLEMDISALVHFRGVASDAAFLIYRAMA